MSLNLEDVTVLFVEDNEAIRQIGLHVLQTIGVGEVILAKDGNEAFKLFKDRPIDIIISDWEMEPISGPDFLQKIRTSSESPDKMVPFIMLTGYASKDRVIEARDAGTNEFIVKPFTAEILAKRIAQIINKPRDFVESPDFSGPDRRRKFDPNFKSEERRKNQWMIN